MSYIATLEGVLKLKDKTIKTTDDLINKIKTTKELDEYCGLISLIDCNAITDIITVMPDFRSKDPLLEIAYCENYDEDEWKQLLEDIKDEVELGSTITGSGEDNSEWRFILKQDGWYEQTGSIVYDDGYKISKEDY